MPASEQTMPATVITGAPLTVKIDGANTACPAKVLDAATYVVGTRVAVTVRNPLPPLVQGTQSA